MFGSSVPPDLDETMNSVLADIERVLERRSAPDRCCRARGSCGQPACEPKVSPSTSGPRLEPPMPSSGHVGEAALLHLLAKASSLPRSARSLSATRQPARAICLRRCRSTGSRRRPTACGSSRACARSPSRRRWRPSARASPASRPGSHPCRRATCAALGDSAQQLVEGIGEGLHAVLDQLVGDSLSEMPSCSRSASSALAPGRSCSTASALTTPWSRKASMVSGGMVLTVSRPISAST